MFQTPVTLKASKKTESPLKLVHIGNHIWLARYRRKFSPEAAARLIGTKERNLLLWELGVSEPRIGGIPGILRFLGYDPFPPSRTNLPERLFAFRRALGLDRKQAASLYGIGERTWGDWELGYHTPFRKEQERLEGFLAIRYEEAVRGWPGNPPEGSIVATACFKVVCGRVINLELDQRTP